MKKSVPILLFSFLSFVGFSQTLTETKKKFSNSEKQINKYRELVIQAMEKNDEKLAMSYRDSVRNSIIRSYLDNHIFRTINNKEFYLDNLNKPVLLITSATWCGPCIGEIPALNKIVEEYQDQVTFLILFHDAKDEKLIKLSKKYNNHALIVPSPKKEENIHTLNI